MSKTTLKKLPKEEFIKLIEASELSERALAASLGISRGFLLSHYKDCQFLAYQEDGTCTTCSKSWLHTVRSRRDSTKYCPTCHSDKLAAKAKDTFAGKPSHKRFLNTESFVDSRASKYLEGTEFTSFKPDPNDETCLLLVCKCGNEISMNLKGVGRQQKAKKLSCGCASLRESSPQRELVEFIESLGFDSSKILINKRPKELGGLELDIFIPKAKIAIEYHGLAFHSTRPIFSKQKPMETVKYQHQNKYLLCKANDIALIQIFEDEWQNNKDLLKSMIRSRLGLSPEHIEAAKTHARLLTVAEKSEFFKENHIAGDANSIITWGLFDGERLVAALSLQDTQNKAPNNVLEITRFAVLRDVSLRGGFTKLLALAKDYANRREVSGLLTYEDCRFGTGNVFTQAEFTHKGKTQPNCFYEKGGVRMGEREQQNTLGWYAIYDAGSEIYLLNL